MWPEWGLAIELTWEIYRVTDAFPKSELFGLTAQIRKSAVSIPSNVAEGAARRTDSDHLHFLYIARGSLEELSTQMEIAEGLGYLQDVDISAALEKFENLEPALGGLIKAVRRGANKCDCFNRTACRFGDCRTRNEGGGLAVGIVQGHS